MGLRAALCNSTLSKMQIQKFKTNSKTKEILNHSTTGLELGVLNLFGIWGFEFVISSKGAFSRR